MQIRPSPGWGGSATGIAGWMEPAKNALIFTPTEISDFRYTVTPGTPVDCFFANEISNHSKHAVFPGEYAMFSLLQRVKTILFIRPQTAASRQEYYAFSMKYEKCRQLHDILSLFRCPLLTLSFSRRPGAETKISTKIIKKRQKMCLLLIVFFFLTSFFSLI